MRLNRASRRRTVPDPNPIPPPCFIADLQSVPAAESRPSSMRVDSSRWPGRLPGVIQREAAPIPSRSLTASRCPVMAGIRGVFDVS